MRALLIFCLVFLTSSEAFAARKNFRGLFGSYRREKFIENEGNWSDFGVDVSLSTLFPVTSIVNSEESTRGNAGAPMYYANFFDYEASAFLSLAYNWQVYLFTGLFTYETRKQNATDQPSVQQDQPLFHEYQMQALPVLLGLRYRFTQTDMVPYVGIAVGAASVMQKASYDYDPPGAYSHTGYQQPVLTAQLAAGIEFYISSQVGIRLELSGLYFKLAEQPYDTPGATPAALPIVIAQANPISLRYSSGLFFLF